MHMLTIALGLSCLAVAQSTYDSGYEYHLNSVPDISHYGKIRYPHLNIHELGEYSHAEHHPEVIKIERTVQVKVPQPYPIQVPHNIPYPVPFKVPHIIRVPHLVKVAQPVPVEVVKHVPVPKQEESYGIQNEGLGNAYGGEYGKATLDSGAFSSYNDGHPNDWQGASSHALGSPSDSYGAEQARALDQHADYSAQQGGYENYGHNEQGGDYSADASSASVVQQAQDAKQVVEPQQEGQH